MIIRILVKKVLLKRNVNHKLLERFDKTSNYIQLKSKNNLIDLIIYFGILLMKKSFAVAFFRFYTYL